MLSPFYCLYCQFTGTKLRYEDVYVILECKTQSRIRKMVHIFIVLVS